MQRWLNLRWAGLSMEVLLSERYMVLRENSWSNDVDGG